MPDVVIYISNGVASVLERPSGVRVIIRDYDVEAVTAATKKDKDGDLYTEDVYED